MSSPVNEAGPLNAPEYPILMSCPDTGLTVANNAAAAAARPEPASLQLM